MQISRRSIATLVLIGAVVATGLAATASGLRVFPWLGSTNPGAVPSETGASSAGSPTAGSGTSSTPAGSKPVSKGAPTSSSPGSSAPAPSPPSALTAAAPTSAVGFKVRGTVVPMGFPLPASVHYTYGAGWRAARVGRPYSYNQIRGVSRNGTLLRAHDGLDLEVALGTPVLAPFDGTVIDPATRWRPWDPSRYGNVVVIVSTEPTSVGYVAIMAHLSRVSVAIGGMVHRGQIVGRTGKTGNAAETTPHLHFELRAPFLIDYWYAGIHRRLDVFDPEPSLRAADPNR